MPDTGWKFPGTAVGNRTITGSDADWNNINNIKADDNSDADTLISGAGDTTSGLAASNFDFSSIPVGATIDGIEVRVGKYVAPNVSATPHINVCRLILADNSDGTENKEADIADPTTTDQTDEAGGSTDVW